MRSRACATLCGVPCVVAALAGSARSLGAFPASFSVSSLNGTSGFVINGVHAGDHSGFSVASAGDVNGDGIDDLVIGGYRASPGGRYSAGESYVVFGKAGLGASGSLELSSLNGTNGFAVRGIDPVDFSGFSVAPAGDINGDGVDDLVVGAYRAGSPLLSGETYVVFGRKVSVAGPFAPAIELSSLNGTNGFAILGIDSYDYSGRTVSSAGDFNGDGVDDLLIGALFADPGAHASAGESYVMFGKKTSVAGPFGATVGLASLTGTNGFVINGIDIADDSGRSVARAGDVNGDGIGDIIIGANFGDPNATSQAGESYVVFGGPGVGTSGSINLSTLNGTTGFVINGVAADDWSGWSVASAGDVNGDGVGDVIVGAYRANPNAQYDAGSAYVVFGKKVSAAGPFAASINLSALNGSDGFVVKGIAAYDQSGRSVSGAGDVNGDGVDDIIVGARYADPGFHSGAGESYVVYGKKTSVAGAFPASVSAASLSGADGFRMTGIDAIDHSGTSVSRCGDVNGDGGDDIIIGAPRGDPGARADAGETYVVFGIPGTVCIGDVNGDGQTNISDFNILAGHFGQTVPAGTLGDLNGNGVVNVADFNILAGDFGCGP